MKSKPHSSAARWRTIAAMKWRNDVAMGVSPWNTYPRDALSPNGTTGTGDAVFPVAPWGLSRVVRTITTGSRPWLVRL